MASPTVWSAVLRLVMRARVPQGRRPDLLDGGFFIASNPFTHTQGDPEAMTTLPTCPTCDASVPMPIGVVAHELITCPDCGTELEVLSVSPFTLDLAPETEEDWGE
jgi:alpha-aminoadipate carrier protein LysW